MGAEIRSGKNQNQRESIVTIRTPSTSEFVAITDVWEASVRATHHFLTGADIDALRPLVLNEYLALVDLRVRTGDDGKIQGFVGVADGKIEMLFVAPQYHGHGIGKALLQYAVTEMGATLVDVNEQNPAATGFYQRMGFSVFDRSPLDGQGRPFPLLHMRLAAPAQR